MKQLPGIPSFMSEGWHSYFPEKLKGKDGDFISKIYWRWNNPISFLETTAAHYGVGIHVRETNKFIFKIVVGVVIGDKLDVDQFMENL